MRINIKSRKLNLDYYLFLSLSFLVVCTLFIICFFIFRGGITAIRKIGLFNFLFGVEWRPELNLYGIFPMIQGSVIVTAVSLLIACPIGIGLAVYIARFSGKKAKKVFISAIDIASSVPSVVYGFIGLMTICPFISMLAGGSGSCIMAGSIVLSLMIIPTISSITVASLEEVDKDLMNASLALGASYEESIIKIELVSCKKSIIAAIILALGRALGETMALIMLTGNQAVLFRGLFKGARTLTTNIALEMGYASGLHREALFATCMVLFIIILVINLTFAIFSKNKEE